MKSITICEKCKSTNIKITYDLLMNDKCYCYECKCETPTIDKYIDDPRERNYRESPFERNERRVYATGNKWAIENWKATHY